MAESVTGTTIPINATITDAVGAIWTIRKSDRAALRNGVQTGITCVMELWYLNHVVWAFKGTHWRQYNTAQGRWKADDQQKNWPKIGMSLTAGLRTTVGPIALASFPGIAISAGTNIQTVVDAHPPGTTYVLGIGTHTQQQVTAKRGDTFVGLHNGTSGAVMDGQSTTGYAFIVNVDYVTIQNIKMINYTNATQFGTVASTGWYLVVQSCEISGATQGASVSCWDYSLCIACDFHDCAQEGYNIHGVGVLFDSCKNGNHNPTGTFWAGSDQGGGKAWNTSSLSFWFCYSYNSQGSHHWTDYNNMNTHIWMCQMRGPIAWNGIEHEISYNASFLYNDIQGIAYQPGMGWFFSVAAIAIEDSGGSVGGGIVGIRPDEPGIIEIAYNNIVVPDYGRAITMRNQARILSNAYSVPDSKRWLRNIYVHHNTIDWSASVNVPDGLMGVVQDTGDTAVFWTNNITYDYNNYIVGSRPAAWVWNNFTGLTFGQWQGFGHDLHGTVTGPQYSSVQWSTTEKNEWVMYFGLNRLTAGSLSDIIFYTCGRTNEAGAIGSGVKRYWEITIADGGGVDNGSLGGIANASNLWNDDVYLGQTNDAVGYFSGTINALLRNGASVLSAETFAQGDVICFAVDGGNKMWVRRNGGNWNNQAIGSQNPATNTGGYSIAGMGTVYPAFNTKNWGKVTANFGSVFAFTPPSGFTYFP